MADPGTFDALEWQRMPDGRQHMCVLTESRQEFARDCCMPVWRGAPWPRPDRVEWCVWAGSVPP